MRKIVYISLIMVFLGGLLLVPVTFDVGTQQVEIQKVDALFGGGCGGFCKAKRLSKKIWNRFLGKGTSGGSAVPTINGTFAFGGRVGAVIPCTCSVPGTFAFFIAPVSGLPGPYAIHTPTSLQSHGVLLSGNSVVGTSVPGGTCGIFVGAWCFFFPVSQTVTPKIGGTGMGTSATP